MSFLDWKRGRELFLANGLVGVAHGDNALHLPLARRQGFGSKVANMVVHVLRHDPLTANDMGLSCDRQARITIFRQQPVDPPRKRF